MVIIWWIMFKSDFEEIKKDLEERRKLNEIEKQKT